MDFSKIILLYSELALKYLMVVKFSFKKYCMPYHKEDRKLQFFFVFTYYILIARSALMLCRTLNVADCCSLLHGRYSSLFFESWSDKQRWPFLSLQLLIILHNHIELLPIHTRIVWRVLRQPLSTLLIIIFMNSCIAFLW